MTQPNASRPDDDLPRVRDAEPAEPAPASPDRELLEQIVRRTLADQEGGDPPGVLVSALRDVARRQRAQAQPWETVVVELVEQVLVNWFPEKLLSGESRRIMAAEIADVLITDPIASVRLRSFWERISEVAP